MDRIPALFLENGSEVYNPMLASEEDLTEEYISEE